MQRNQNTIERLERAMEHLEDAHNYELDNEVKVTISHIHGLIQAVYSQYTKEKTDGRQTAFQK